MYSEKLLSVLVAVPGVVVLMLSLSWLFGLALAERTISRVTKAVYALLIVTAVLLVLSLWRGHVDSVTMFAGHWFTVGDYGFDVVLLADRLSVPFALLTVVLAGIVGAFSVRYLHRDPGFFRFFLLLHLFTLGSLLVFLAGSLDLLVAGWELVGITSVLLVGFFQYRRDPVKNALRVFTTYRVADLCILIAIFVAHHSFGAASWAAMFSGTWPEAENLMHGPAATVLAVLLVLAASGKSSQGPFYGWLPRAMEGPTPSSAVFYGAISVHAGAYLLLRAEPLILSSKVATVVLVTIGLGTAFLGTLVHRTCADAKTSVAYASQTQLGLIFAEIGFGWTTMALVHITGHAVLRTLQFLRTPSMLRDYHRLHAASGGNLDPTGSHYESILPARVQHWLYRFALGRGFYDSVVDRFVAAPVLMVAKLLGVFEPAAAAVPELKVEEEKRASVTVEII